MKEPPKRCSASSSWSPATQWQSSNGEIQVRRHLRGLLWMGLLLVSQNSPAQLTHTAFLYVETALCTFPTRYLWEWQLSKLIVDMFCCLNFKKKKTCRLTTELFRLLTNLSSCRELKEKLKSKIQVHLDYKPENYYRKNIFIKSVICEYIWLRENYCNPKNIRPASKDQCYFPEIPV